jgi:hypothetical protein
MWLVFFSWPVAITGVLAIFRRVTGASDAALFGPIVVPIGVTAFATMFVLSRFACPRCGKPFASRPLFSNILTRHCLNCGIKIGTPKSP